MQTTIIEDEYMQPRAAASIAGLAPWQVERIRSMIAAHRLWLARGEPEAPEPLPSVHDVVRARHARAEFFALVARRLAERRARRWLSVGLKDFAGG